jgi:hypothetical protein
MGSSLKYTPPNGWQRTYNSIGPLMQQTHREAAFVAIGAPGV